MKLFNFFIITLTLVALFGFKSEKKINTKLTIEKKEVTLKKNIVLNKQAILVIHHKPNLNESDIAELYDCVRLKHPGVVFESLIHRNYQQNTITWNVRTPLIGTNVLSDNSGCSNSNNCNENEEQITIHPLSQNLCDNLVHSQIFVVQAIKQ